MADAAENRLLRGRHPLQRFVGEAIRHELLCLAVGRQTRDRERPLLVREVTDATDTTATITASLMIESLVGR